MKKWLIYALIAAAGAATPPSLADESAAIEQGKAYFLNQLKDPDSAQWRNLRPWVGQKDGETTHILCGELNAKNSYGGYVGFRPFYYIDGKGEILNEDNASLFPMMADAICP